MSYDRQIDQLCPHLIVGEYLTVSGDRNLAIPMRPISSAGSVVVRVNGLAEVPSYGVDIPASSGGTREGPFTISAGVNDTLKLRVNDGAWQVVVLPAGVKVPVKRICELLTAGFSGVQFFASGNIIKFKTNLSGRDSTVYIHSDSSLAVAAGIRVNREYRGKRTFPGWTLVNDPNTVNDRPSRMVVFDEPLPSSSNFVEINYTTVREECRRCGGLGVENDWRYTSNGNLLEATKEALLLQELQKVIYSSRGSNPFHPWYGTTIIELIGQKMVMGGILQNRIVSDIQTTFGRWQSIKKQQEENVGQIVTDEEYPFQLQSVNLEQSQSDPTVLFVTVTIRNRSFNPIQFTRGLRVPLPEDLMGSTQQDAILKGVQNYSLVK